MKGAAPSAGRPNHTPERKEYPHPDPTHCHKPQPWHGLHCTGQQWQQREGCGDRPDRG